MIAIASDGLSEDIPVQSGVRQGCPLFALAISPILTKIQKDEKEHGILAFADDIVLMSESEEELQAKMEVVKEGLDSIALKLNAKKCKTMHLSGDNPCGVRPTTFFLGGEQIPKMAEGEPVRFLGKMVSFPQMEEVKKIEDVIKLVKIFESKLAPWQKLEALRDFVFSTLMFPVRNAAFRKKEIIQLDTVIKKHIKETLCFPQMLGPPGYLYGERRAGYLGFMQLTKDLDMAVIDSAFKLLTSRNVTIRKLALADLALVVAHRVKRRAALGDAENFLNGKLMKSHQSQQTNIGPSGHRQGFFA